MPLLLSLRKRIYYVFKIFRYITEKQTYTLVKKITLSWNWNHKIDVAKFSRRWLKVPRNLRPQLPITVVNSEGWRVVQRFKKLRDSDLKVCKNEKQHFYYPSKNVSTKESSSGEVFIGDILREEVHKALSPQWKILMKKNLKLVSAIFYQMFIFDQIIALHKIWKVFFVSSEKLFSFSRYSNFCISVFPSFSPCQPLL